MLRGAFVKTAWVLALITLAAFFLPWIKGENVGFRVAAARERLAGELASESARPWYARFFGLRARDWREASERPLEGESGFRLVALTRSASVADRLRVMRVAMAFGLKDSRLGAVLAYALPAFALLGAGMFTLGSASRWPLLFGAAAAIGLYLLFRNGLDETELDRAVAGIGEGAGLWLSLYGLLGIGILLLLGAFLPGGRK